MLCPFIMPNASAVVHNRPGCAPSGAVKRTRPGPCLGWNGGPLRASLDEQPLPAQAGRGPNFS